MMGYINFKEDVLIKKQRVNKKKNVTSRMFKDEKR